MDVRVVVLFTVVAACFLLAIAVSRIIVVHGSKLDAPSRASEAGSVDGVDLRNVSASNPYMRDER
jgi:hypothetical protein